MENSILLMAYFKTKLDLSRQSKLFSGDVADWGGSLNIGEQLTVSGNTFLTNISNGATEDDLLSISGQGLVQRGSLVAKIDSLIQTGFGLNKVASGSTITLFNTGVLSFNGRTGNVTPEVSDYNTDLVVEGFTNKYYNETYVSNFINSIRNQANGLVGLNANSKIDSIYLPALAITNTSVISTTAEMLALVAEAGDVAIIRSGDTQYNYILRTEPASDINNWEYLGNGSNTDTLQDVMSRGNTTTEDLIFTRVSGNSTIKNTADVANLVFQGAGGLYDGPAMVLFGKNSPTNSKVLSFRFGSIGSTVASMQAQNNGVNFQVSAYASDFPNSGVRRYMVLGIDGKLLLENNDDTVVSYANYKLEVKDSTNPINAKFHGRVIGGDAVNNDEFVTYSQLTTLASSGGHTHSFSSLTDKPTLLSGYGITSNDTLFDGRYILNQDSFTQTANIKINGTGTLNKLILLNGETYFMGSGYDGAGIADNKIQGNTLINTGNFTVTNTVDSTIILNSNRSGTALGYSIQANSLEGFKFINKTANRLDGYFNLNGGLVLSNIVITSPYKLEINDPNPISAKFSGRVIGADAVNTNEFVTLTQLNSATSNVDLSNYNTKTEISRFFSGADPIIGYNASNWDTAHSWGNHSGLYKSIGWFPTWSEVTSKPNITLDYVLANGNLAFNYLSLRDNVYITKTSASDNEYVGGRIQISQLGIADETNAERAIALHLGNDGDLLLTQFRRGPNIWNIRMRTSNLDGHTTFYNGLTATSFTEGSLRILKENISDLTFSPLELVNSVNVQQFNLIDDEQKELRVGFIADDTDEILSTSNKDKMNHGNTIGVLLGAVQELSKEIQELKTRIIQLEN